MRRVLVAAVVLILGAGRLFSLTTVSTNAGEVPTNSLVRKIHIRVKEVFPEDKNFFFDVANAFHARTAEATIRNELLYDEGEPYNQDLVDESERNLRKLNICVVERTRAVPVPGEPGQVDVFVEVRDIWSLYFNIKLESSGGVTRYNFKWGERNFLGRNLSLELELDRDTFFNRWRQHFDEPRLFGSRWRFFERVGFYYDHDGNKVGEGIELYLIRPLYARSEKWGWQTSFQYDDEYVIKNEGDRIKEVEVAPGVFLPRKYYDKSYVLENALIRSFGYTNKFNIGLYVRNEQNRYRGYDGLPAEYADAFRSQVMNEDSTHHKLGLLLDANNHRFVRIRNLNNYGRIEDLALGTSIRTTLSASRTFWGSDENGWYSTITLSNTAMIGDNHISMVMASFSSDFVAGLGQRDMVTTLRYVHHIRNLPLGTLSLRAETSIGERLENDSLLSLGSDKGLRGYVSNRFEGDRRVVFNVEYRFDPLPFIENPWIAFAAFYDLGACWFNHERRLADVRFYPAIGLGLRLSIPSLNPAMMRFDFGFNLGNGPSTIGSIFSFGYNHAF
ncbi:MAG TPA: BamA/TamA family outer membrane protein [Spirochaetota bacterium]|nr:BamA/TamA family outer membrane protein [Spirochaetota bacterium]